MSHHLVLVQAGAQRPYRRVQPALDRALRDAQLLGDPAYRQVGVEAQDQYLTLGVGQVVEALGRRRGRADSCPRRRGGPPAGAGRRAAPPAVPGGAWPGASPWRGWRRRPPPTPTRHAAPRVRSRCVPAAAGGPAVPRPAGPPAAHRRARAPLGPCAPAPRPAGRRVRRPRGRAGLFCAAQAPSPSPRFPYDAEGARNVRPKRRGTSHRYRSETRAPPVPGRPGPVQLASEGPCRAGFSSSGWVRRDDRNRTRPVFRPTTRACRAKDWTGCPGWDA